MSLELYYHPLASYCWKVLVALYENEIAFEPRLIDLGNAASRAELTALWPFAKFPLLRDTRTNAVVPESSIIIEYLAQHHPGRIAFIPTDPTLALETRAQDRFFDVYVHEPMQKIVGDKLRPEGKTDPLGVEQAKATLDVAFDLLDERLATRSWAAGDAFTMADCAAAPALHYANRVRPIGSARPNVAAYLARLEARPSFARVLTEAAPYFHMFPG